MTEEERERTIADLVREVTSLWQTDELRRKKPTPLDGEGVGKGQAWRGGAGKGEERWELWA